MRVTDVVEQPPQTEADERPPGVRYRWAFIEMLISSVIGLVASLVLSADAVILAANPNAELSCNISSRSPAPPSG